jgi:hypothetical protein
MPRAAAGTASAGVVKRWEGFLVEPIPESLEVLRRLSSTGEVDLV